MAAAPASAPLTLYAGLPKTGSSSVQAWLARNAERLRDSHDIVVAVAREGDPISIVPYDGSGTINSVDLVAVMTWEPDRRGPALRAFLAGLESLCESHTHVIVASEAFGSLLWRPDEDFVLGLEELASRRAVRLAYYVPQQHLALEAAWRQWGFRSKGTPALFLTLRAEHMDFASAYFRAQDLAPSVEFRLRPFREDLLAGGDVVADFARGCLGLDEAPASREIVNPGLPLEVVNLLRDAPAGMFWDSIHDNATLRQIKGLLADLELGESDGIRRSRAILQAYCHERFEAGNRKLIRQLGWPVAEWVPAPAADVPADLAELDSLWTPQASAAERDVLYAAIRKALGR